MVQIIVITGTPGTGKSTLARIISKKVQAELFEINTTIVENELYDEWDENRNIPIIDDDKINNFFLNFIKKIPNNTKLIAEGHYFEFISDEIINKIIILRTNPPKLKERLKSRNFSESKINENIQAEILGNIMGVIIHEYQNIPLLQVDTSNDNIEQSSRVIIDFINEKVSATKPSEFIDWLPILEEKKELEKYF